MIARRSLTLFAGLFALFVALMVLNYGPHHPATHGVFRIVLNTRGATA